MGLMSDLAGLPEVAHPPGGQRLPLGERLHLGGGVEPRVEGPALTQGSASAGALNLHLPVRLPRDPRRRRAEPEGAPAPPPSLPAARAQVFKQEAPLTSPPGPPWGRPCVPPGAPGPPGPVPVPPALCLHLTPSLQCPPSREPHLPPAPQPASLSFIHGTDCCYRLLIMDRYPRPSERKTTGQGLGVGQCPGDRSTKPPSAHGPWSPRGLTLAHPSG